jgi:glycosyltransferase involved in cell wall biosynthesis
VVANIHHPLAIDRRNDLAQTKGLRHRIGRIVWYPWLMQRIVAHRIDRIITGSDTSAASVQEALGLPRERIAVIHDGVDADVFRPLDEREPEPGHVLFVGNSEDRNKGARYLIEALNILQHDMDFTLTLVDRKMKDLKIVPPLVWKYGLTRLVRYTGHVSTDELVRLYNSAQVLVSPSLYEGFGLPAAEAMACGTPVIATRAGALPEIIDDGGSGLLVPPADPRALAEAIRRLLADRQLCRRMGEAGRRRILERFTWRETTRRTVDLYQEVLASRRKARPSAQPVP